MDRRVVNGNLGGEHCIFLGLFKRSVVEDGGGVQGDVRAIASGAEERLGFRIVKSPLFCGLLCSRLLKAVNLLSDDALAGGHGEVGCSIWWVGKELWLKSATSKAQA